MLNSASIEGRNDGLSAIHIPRCRHRHCDVGSTRRSPPAMLGQILRPGDTFHRYPFRRASFDKANVDRECLDIDLIKRAPKLFPYDGLSLPTRSLGEKLRSVMPVTIRQE